MRISFAVILLQMLSFWTTPMVVSGFHPHFITSNRCIRSAHISRRNQVARPKLFMWDLLDQDVVSSILSVPSSLVVSDAGMSAPPETAGISYSKVSYFTILGLYVMSFPGLWSIITRSTTAKIKRKTYTSPGEKATEPVADKAPLSLRQQAGEILAYMKANNYEVSESNSETITFRGVVQRSLSQAFFLTFCTALGLLSLALVLQIQFQDVTLFGMEPNWFYIALLSPYAGIYYWSAGDRIDTCQVKLETNADETVNEITIQGNEDEMERMWRTLQWQEKGMIKVDGILASTSS
jgi:Cofactor assembly of complex C subunit B